MEQPFVGKPEQVEPVGTVDTLRPDEKINAPLNGIDQAQPRVQPSPASLYAPQGAAFSFPGLHGVPAHTGTDLLRGEEVAKLELRQSGQARVLSLDVTADMAVFQSVVAEVAAGKAVITRELFEYDAGIKSWRVLLCWSSFFYAPPPRANVPLSVR